jgi:hypothetical protein
MSQPCDISTIVEISTFMPRIFRAIGDELLGIDFAGTVEPLSQR